MWTLVAGLALMACLVAIGLTAPVPFVAIGRGPTIDTLGQKDGTEVVAVKSLPQYPTSGHLNMTTVSVTDRLTLVEALRRWTMPDYKIVARNTVFPPGESDSEVAERNRQQFADSQSNAKGAALSYLGLPTTVLVDDLTDGSPSAGILEAGDVLVEVAGRRLATYGDLSDALADTRPGQEITVRFVRGDSAPQQATVTLVSGRDGPQGALGLVPGLRPATDDEIVISLGDVGGPSAGLMFALAVVDKLTPGELTGGRFIAGTGTIRSTGAVGPIDGIPFKMLAAREAGATVFLAPAANCKEAAATAPDGLALVKVDDLAGAIASLDTLRAGGTPASC